MLNSSTGRRMTCLWLHAGSSRRSSRPRPVPVQLVIESSSPVAQVARELPIDEGALGKSIRAWRSQHPEPEAEPQLRQLRTENELLNVAVAFSARTPLERSGAC